MAHFTAHEGQATIIVRGSMHHEAMTPTEFTEWLQFEDCTRSAWVDSGMMSSSCMIRRADGSVRSIAIKLDAEQFETERAA